MDLPDDDFDDISLTMTDEREELRALAAFNDVLGGPSFIMRSHWRHGYQRLVRRGLVKWGEPPEGFDRRVFAGIEITAKGRELIQEPHP